MKILINDITQLCIIINVLLYEKLILQQMEIRLLEKKVL